jgi:hypothetical protein
LLVPSRRPETHPSSASTFKCRDAVLWGTCKTLHNSATDNSDLSKTRNILLRVGSDKLCIQAIIEVVALMKNPLKLSPPDYPLIRMKE